LRQLLFLELQPDRVATGIGDGREFVEQSQDEEHGSIRSRQDTWISPFHLKQGRLADRRALSGDGNRYAAAAGIPNVVAQLAQGSGHRKRESLGGTEVWSLNQEQQSFHPKAFPPH
jgi:hypothetical protein